MNVEYDLRRVAEEMEVESEVAGELVQDLCEFAAANGITFDQALQCKRSVRLLLIHQRIDDIKTLLRELVREVENAKRAAYSLQSRREP